MPFDLVTGIEDDPDADWSVYPNPATGYFTIDVAAMHGVVKIYNTTGKLVYTVTMDNSAGMLNTHEVRIPGGVYLVTFEDGTKLRSKRIVVY